jgi:hypothetical protein
LDHPRCRTHAVRIQFIGLSMRSASFAYLESGLTLSVGTSFRFIEESTYNRPSNHPRLRYYLAWSRSNGRNVFDFRLIPG